MQVLAKVNTGHTSHLSYTFCTVQGQVQATGRWDGARQGGRCCDVIANFQLLPLLWSTF